MDTRFGGHVKSGESIQSAVRNEIKEEIGLDIDPDRLTVGNWEKRSKFPNREYAKIFYYEYNGNLADLNFNDGEVQQVKWLDQEIVIKTMIECPKNWAGSGEEFKRVLNDLGRILQT